MTADVFIEMIASNRFLFLLFRIGYIYTFNHHTSKTCVYEIGNIHKRSIRWKHLHGKLTLLVGWWRMISNKKKYRWENVIYSKYLLQIAYDVKYDTM